MVGSLDHVLVNDAALATVQGVDIWDINSYESVYYEYARFNANVTNLYAPNPYRSSDHNPEIVGIKTSPRRRRTCCRRHDGQRHGRHRSTTARPAPWQ